MDFNLSSICDMLADRIEEYKSTTKKRRLGKEEGGTVRRFPKRKFDKFTSEKCEKIKKNCIRMYASTPKETPNSRKKEYPQLNSMFSTINKLSSSDTPLRHRLSKQNIQGRKLTFDDDEGINNEKAVIKMEKSLASPASFHKVEDKNYIQTDVKMEQSLGSPASFSSVTKLPRRRILKQNINVRRLTFVDDDTDDLLENTIRNSIGEAKLDQDEAMKTLTPDLQMYPKIDKPIIDDNSECLSNNSFGEAYQTAIDSSLKTFEISGIKCLNNESPVLQMDINNSARQELEDSEIYQHITMVLNVGVVIRPIKDFL